MIGDYKPGRYNMGTKLAMRMVLLFVLFLAIAAIIYLLTTNYSLLLLKQPLPHWIALLCFVPILFAIENLSQAYLRFSTGYATRGIYDFAGTSGEQGEVKRAEDHQFDMKIAMKIHRYCIMTAIVLTLIIYFAI